MMWLSADQLADLTKRKQGKAQRRALDRLGIPYRVGLDGRPVVFENDLSSRQDSTTKAGPKLDRI